MGRSPNVPNASWVSTWRTSASRNQLNRWLKVSRSRLGWFPLFGHALHEQPTRLQNFSVRALLNANAQHIVDLGGVVEVRGERPFDRGARNLGYAPIKLPPFQGFDGDKQPLERARHAAPDQEGLPEPESHLRP